MKTKYLYLLKREDKLHYDQYDSLVVCAENEVKAALIKPNCDKFTWTTCFSIKLLGKAANWVKVNSIVIESFNAG